MSTEEELWAEHCAQFEESAVVKSPPLRGVDAEDLSTLPPAAVVYLSRSHIEAAKSSKGGFGRRQLASIGVRWPLPPDWQGDVLGQPMAASAVRNFIAMRDEHLKKGKPRDWKKKSRNRRPGRSDHSIDGEYLRIVKSIQEEQP